MSNLHTMFHPRSVLHTQAYYFFLCNSEKNVNTSKVIFYVTLQKLTLPIMLNYLSMLKLPNRIVTCLPSNLYIA